MSKILVVKSLPEGTTGILFLDRSDSHASVVEMGEGVSLDNGVLSATGGGGGGGSVNDLSDVFMGEITPAGPSQVLFSLSADEGVNHWVNIDFNTIVSGALTSVLAGFPGRAAGKVLAVNATDDGFEWITP